MQWLTRPKLDPLEMISENKAVIGFNLIWLWDQVHELEPVLDAMIDFGFRPPPIGLARPFQGQQKTFGILTFQFLVATETRFGCKIPAAGQLEEVIFWDNHDCFGFLKLVVRRLTPGAF